MKKIIIFIITLCFLSAESQAQCYLKYTDASGLSLSTEDQKTLMDSACALRDSFPKALRDSFAVVDFGFYAYNENMDGGYPEFMNLMTKRLAENPKTKYYLLFGRESSSARGPNSKIWVKVVLPKWGNFKCMSEIKRNLVGIRCERVLDSIYTDKKVLQVCYSELRVMKNLKAQVAHIIDCCSTRSENSCSLECVSAIDITDYFKQKKFDFIPCNFDSVESIENVSANYYQYAKVKIIESNKLKTLNDELSKLSDFFIKSSKKYKIIITNDLNFCESPSASKSSGDNLIRSGVAFDIVNLTTIFDDPNLDYALWINASKNNKGIFFKTIARDNQPTVNDSPCNCSRANPGKASEKDKAEAIYEVNQFEKNDSTKTVWKKIDKKEFCKELKALILYFNLDQANSYLCGPAATLKVFMEYAPKDFVKFAINLYQFGEDSPHNPVNWGCYGFSVKANSNLIGNNRTNGLSNVGYVLLTSMRNSNNLIPYDPKTDIGVTGFGWPSESFTFLHKFGCIKNTRAVHFYSPLIFVPSTYINKVLNKSLLFDKDFSLLHKDISEGHTLLALITHVTQTYERKLK